PSTRTARSRPRSSARVYTSAPEHETITSPTAISAASAAPPGCTATSTTPTSSSASLTSTSSGSVRCLEHSTTPTKTISKCAIASRQPRRLLSIPAEGQPGYAPYWRTDRCVPPSCGAKVSTISLPSAPALQRSRRPTSTSSTSPSTADPPTSANRTLPPG